MRVSAAPKVAPVAIAMPRYQDPPWVTVNKPDSFAPFAIYLTLFMLLAWWGVQRPRLNLALLTCQLLLLVLLTFEFVGGAFVA